MGVAVPRLFISHSSHDNAVALAIRQWLVANGWAESDVFIDLHDLRAGARWRAELRKANTACEAVLLLASPEALDSPECQEELKLADILEKEIIPVIARDLALDDPRLGRYKNKEIQIVDLRTAPTERVPSVEYKGQLHELSFSTAALAAIKARLDDLGISPGSFPWTPHKAPDGRVLGPYPGLAAFGEEDAGIFFGREADIVAGLAKLKLMRKRRSPRLLIIQAASGAGKSSFLRAGLWPRLKRDPDFVPLAILRPAQGILTGPDGLAQRVVPWFERQRKKKVPGDIEASLLSPDKALAAAALADLLSEATALATAVRRAGVVDARPPAPLIGVDQGEELFASENAAEAERFLALLAAVFNDLPEDVDPYVLLTIRADSVEPLLQRWPALGLAAPETQMLPPLSPTAYRDVIAKPAEVYTSRVRRLVVEPALADRLANDATGADALPLLAFTLEKLYEKFGADGNLTLARYEGLGGIGGSIDRALALAQREAGQSGAADDLRRLLVPGLATWDMAANAAKRIVASEAELLSGDRAGLKSLAEALVANRLLTRGSGTLEVAHEALLRRPLIAGWLEAQKDALNLRDNVLKEAKEWAEGGRHAEMLLRRGARLEAAKALEADRDFASALKPAKDYLDASQRLETAAKRRARRTVAAGFVLMAGVIASLSAAVWKDELEALRFRLMDERNYISAQIRPMPFDKERTLKPGDSFRECLKDCPEMVVVPAGSFLMGSPDGEKGRYPSEGPVHPVTIVKPFAVGKFTVTWDDWEVCVTMRGCDGRPTGDAGFGKGNRPVINVTWDQAQSYVAWFGRMTGKEYRLLTEAEWEYAARGVTSKDAPHPAYPWGDDDICKHANLADKSYSKRYSGEAVDCDDKWQNTSPVGSFPANAFGLHDMHGNVFQWLQDGWHENYEGDPPSDGSEWIKDADTSRRVVRGGSWGSGPRDLRSASRGRDSTDGRYDIIGFRVGRTLSP